MILNNRGECQLCQCFRNPYDRFQLPGRKKFQMSITADRIFKFALRQRTGQLSELNFSRRCPVPPAVLASSTPQNGCSVFLVLQVTAGAHIFYHRQEHAVSGQTTSAHTFCSHVRFAICDIAFHLIQIYLPFSIARLPAHIWSVHVNVHDMLCNELLGTMSHAKNGITGACAHVPYPLLRCARPLR